MVRSMVKKKKERKAPAISRKSKFARMAEEKHIGYEITDWSVISPENFEKKLMETLNHYNYFYDYKDTFKWAEDWVKANRTKTELKHFKNASQMRFSATAGRLAKIVTNGATLSSKHHDFMIKHIEAAIQEGKKATSSEKSEEEGPKRTPADILKEKTSDFIARIEETLDTFNTKTYVDWDQYSVYNELKSADAAYNTAKAVAEYYGPLKEELTELVVKKTADLVEGYSKMSIAKRKQYLKIVEAIIADAEKFMQSKKAVRKTRVKKVASVGQQVSRMKYLPESKEYKVTSSDPTSIVGAAEVYLFNTKYRRLTYLVSSSSSGFQVKGTTIQNIDIEASYTKTLRKPEEFFTAFMKATKAKARNLAETLATKKAAVNGRTSEDTLILKVY